ALGPSRLQAEDIGPSSGIGGGIHRVDHRASDGSEHMCESMSSGLHYDEGDALRGLVAVEVHLADVDVSDGLALWVRGFVMDGAGSFLVDFERDFDGFHVSSPCCGKRV